MIVTTALTLVLKFSKPICAPVGGVQIVDLHDDEWGALCGTKVLYGHLSSPLRCVRRSDGTWWIPGKIPDDASVNCNRSRAFVEIEMKKH